MDSSNGISPSATIIRIRRKRSAEPISGLIVSTKRNRSDEGTSNGDRSTENLFYRLAGSGKAPSECMELLNREKVVEVVDYDIEQKAPTNKEIAVVDDNYRRLMEAVDSVKTMGISDVNRSEDAEASSIKQMDVEMEIPKAPLAEPEDDSEYVYDFYWTNKGQILPLDSMNVRLPTDDELKLYFGFEDIDESDEADDDNDSNAENYYKNDYPDEGQFADDNENDTTSDDSYDHYGDRHEEYEDCCYESSDE